MKFSKTIYLFLLIGFFACQDVDKAEKPENLIPENKMVNVLVDLLKLDGAESMSSIEFEKRDVKTKELIFKKYQVDSLQFVKSTEYYAENFKVNQRIYDSVQARLEREKTLLDSLVKKEREQATDAKDLNKEEENFKSFTKKVELKKDLEVDSTKTTR